MSDDKKLNITGEVKIDQGKATSDLQALKGELDGFKKSLDHVATGIELILRSLAGMAQSMQSSTAESKAAAAATKVEAENMQKAAKASAEVQRASTGAAKSVKEVATQTEHVAAKTEVVRGAWQRIGHQAIDMVANSLQGLIRWMFRTADEASKIDGVFARMSARGVDNVDKLRISVVELAGAMEIDLSKALEAVDLAEQLGAGEEAVNVARAALENYKVTGMDVASQIERSSQIVKTFNLNVTDQADVMRDVAEASQQAHVKQEMLWSGMVSLGPKIRQIGGSFKDMMDILRTSAASGMKIDASGPGGFNQFLDSMIKGSADFTEKLVELGGVITQSSPRWQELKGSIESQKDAFNGLNAEISEYKQQATDIGLMANKTEMLMAKYQALAGKKENGERLNRLERKALRETTEALHEQNRALSAYDQQGMIVQNHDWKRLSLIEQLQQRLDSAKSAQAELTLKTQEAQQPLEAMKASISATNAEFTTLSGKLASEVPTALKTVVENEGVSGLIAKLKSLPGVMQSLPAETQAFVNQYNTSLGTLVTNTGTQIGTIDQQMQKLKASGADAMASLRTNMTTLGTTLVGPIAKAMDGVAKVIIDKLNEPFQGGSSIFERITEWSAEIGARLSGDIKAYIDGDMSLADLFILWIGGAIYSLIDSLGELIGEFFVALWDEFRNGKPELEQKLAAYFLDMGQKAVAALRSAFVGWMDDLTMPVQNLFYDNMNQGGSAQLGTRSLAVQSAGTQAAGAPINVTVNGATDPMAVAREVGQQISQQQRLGYSGARMR